MKTHLTIPVVMARGTHPFSSRTRKLSLLALKVLGWTRPGRRWHRRISLRRAFRKKCSFFVSEDSGAYTSLPHRSEAVTYAQVCSLRASWDSLSPKRSKKHFLCDGFRPLACLALKLPFHSRLIVAFIGSFALPLRATLASAIRSAAHFRYDN